MSIPKITNTVMNGNVCNLLRRRNRINSDTIVKPKVKMLKVWKVWIKEDNGLVNAEEFAARKNALIFSMESGKNYIIIMIYLH